MSVRYGRHGLWSFNRFCQTTTQSVKLPQPRSAVEKLWQDMWALVKSSRTVSPPEIFIFDRSYFLYSFCRQCQESVFGMLSRQLGCARCPWSGMWSHLIVDWPRPECGFRPSAAKQSTETIFICWPTFPFEVSEGFPFHEWKVNVCFGVTWNVSGKCYQMLEEDNRLSEVRRTAAPWGHSLKQRNLSTKRT